jgi:hypothetical protein
VRSPRARTLSARRRGGNGRRGQGAAPTSPGMPGVSRDARGVSGRAGAGRGTRAPGSGHLGQGRRAGAGPCGARRLASRTTRSAWPEVPRRQRDGKRSQGRGRDGVHGGHRRWRRRRRCDLRRAPRAERAAQRPPRRSSLPGDGRVVACARGGPSVPRSRGGAPRGEARARAGPPPANCPLSPPFERPAERRTLLIYCDSRHPDLRSKRLVILVAGVRNRTPLHVVRVGTVRCRRGVLRRAPERWVTRLRRKRVHVRVVGPSTALVERRRRRVLAVSPTSRPMAGGVAGGARGCPHGAR